MIVFLLFYVNSVVPRMGNNWFIASALDRNNNIQDLFAVGMGSCKYIGWRAVNISHDLDSV